MLHPRITPCLLVSNGGLVKTEGFSSPKYVGDPLNAVKIFNEKRADELIILDIDATIRGREPDYRMIGHIATECRMPLCYGGGIKNVQQARRIVSLGVEKVAISSEAIQRPQFVSELAKELGSQSVVVVFDVRRVPGTLNCRLWTHNAKQLHSTLLDQAIATAQSFGAGEIVVNSVDEDGRMRGYDLDLARYIRRLTHLPLTVLGGAGRLEHIAQLIDTCGVVGAAAGSLFVFKGSYRAVLINYPDSTQRDALYRRITTLRGSGLV